MKKSKKIVIWIVKIVLSIIIFFFLAKKINFSEVLQNITHLSFSIIAIVLILSIIKITLDILNWANYLKIDPHYKLKKSQVISSYFIGYSLQFLIPGGAATIGKVLFIENKKKHTFISLGVEKFFQIWLVLLFSFFSSIFYFHILPMIVRVLIFLVIFFLPFTLLLFQNVFSTKWSHFFINYKKKIIKIILLRIIYMLCTISQYYFILNFFSSITFFKTIIGTSLTLFSGLIPITYAGLGLRETFAMEIFPHYGIEKGIAVAASLTVFIVSVALPALVGLIFLIRGNKTEQ